MVFQAPDSAFNRDGKLSDSTPPSQLPMVLVEEGDSEKMHVAALRLFAKSEIPMTLRNFPFKWNKDNSRVAWHQ